MGVIQDLEAYVDNNRKLYTAEANQSFRYANQSAQRHNREVVRTEDLLLGIIERLGECGNPNDPLFEILQNEDIKLRDLFCSLRELSYVGPEVITIGRLPSSSLVQLSQVSAAEYSLETLRDSKIDDTHLVYGLMDVGEGIAHDVLLDFGLTLVKYTRLHHDIRKSVPI